MAQKSLVYYGYSKETYQSCIEMINSLNRKHAIIMNLWFLAMNVLYMLLSAMNLFGVPQERILFYAGFAVFSAVYAVLMEFLPTFTFKHTRFFVNTNIIVLASYGIIVSAIQPYMPAIMYFIMYIFVSLLYAGSMLRMLLTTLFGTSALLGASFLFKTFSIAYHDLYNSIIVTFLTIGLHYMFQHARIEQFILYQRDLQIQRELEIKSSFDSLTALLNRGRFFSVAEEILRYRAKSGEYVALCLLDLDGFKQINDRLGHQMGDKVIQMTGQILAEVVDETGVFRTERRTSEWDFSKKISICGRLGGDEFIVLLRGKNSREEVVSLLEKLLGALNAVRLEGFSGIQSSIGFTEILAGELDIDGAYSRADAALYESKREGKNQIRFSDNIGGEK